MKKVSILFLVFFNFNPCFSGWYGFSAFAQSSNAKIMKFQSFLVACAVLQGHFSLFSANSQIISNLQDLFTEEQDQIRQTLWIKGHILWIKVTFQTVNGPILLISQSNCVSSKLKNQHQAVYFLQQNLFCNGTL